MAVAAERLLAYGHRDVMKYTPKQLLAYSKLANSRRDEEILISMNAIRTAFHATKVEFEKAVKGIKRG